MFGTLVLLCCIIAGMTVGFLQRRNTGLLRAADSLSMYAVYALLFVLGAKLGTDEEVLAALPFLGGRAVFISLICTAGSVLCLVPISRFFRSSSPARKATAAGPSPFAGSLRILGAFGAGIVPALFSLTPAWLTGDAVVTYALYLLVFFVGIGLGADLRAFRIIRDLHIRIIAVPVLIIAGSTLGAGISSLVLDGLSLRDALVVGSGLGYYSLSSVIIMDISGDSALASMALLSNITREVAAILAAPLLARYCGSVSTVGASGATAMDTTLPVIARFSGEHVAVVAVFSGMVLTLLVPFLVTATLYL